MPFSECITEEHKPMCVCKEEFHGNGTDVCIPVGFTTEDNKRGYRWDKRGNRWDKRGYRWDKRGYR